MRIGGTTRIATVLLATAALGASAPPPPLTLPGGLPKGFAEGPTIAIVPFRNVSGEPDAVPTVMQNVWRELETRGFEPAGNGRVVDHLRERRIRARNAMSREQSLELARRMGARYLLLGTIDAWAINGGPEVGLTARIVEPARSRVVWVGSVTLHAVEAPGLLALGRPRTLQDAGRKAVHRLFASLALEARNGDVVPVKKRRRPGRNLLAARPIAYRSPELARRKPLRVALLPLGNRTSSPEAPAVVGDHLLAQLLGLSGLEVVDPGELRRALIESDIQPLYGLERGQLRQLRAELDIDAVLDGTVLMYENGQATVPRLDVFARLRDADSGEVLWSATTYREGNRTRTIYDVGRIRGIHRLADATVSDLLSTWFR